MGTSPLRLARIDTEVGPECFADARSWPPVGTRFAILGFSHSLSLQPWKDTRTPAHVCLRHSAGRPHTCPGGRCQGVLGLRLTRHAGGQLLRLTRLRVLVRPSRLRWEEVRGDGRDVGGVPWLLCGPRSQLRYNLGPDQPRKPPHGPCIRPLASGADPRMTEGKRPRWPLEDPR